jgi:hypothetical protein
MLLSFRIPILKTAMAEIDPINNMEFIKTDKYFHPHMELQIKEDFIMQSFLSQKIVKA